MNFDPKNRQQLLLAITLGVVGLWVADSVVFTPLAAAWKTRNERIDALRKQLADGEKLLQREQPLQTRWRDMRKNTLPVEISAAESKVLGAFDGWSRDARVTVTSIKPQWKRPDDDYTTLECRVDAAGSLSTLIRFLYEVEADPLALKVDSVEIGSRDSTGGQLTLGLQVSGLVLSIEKR